MTHPSALSAVDCAHGIPINLRCGACEAETRPMDIVETLTERGNRYGQFTEHARITQAIKHAMMDSPNWATMADDQREALEMLAHKVGRILNGDPDYHDSWHDIIGYTKLVADRLEGVVR
jgi:histidinol phosphatase-like PHP family hydrolase